MLLFDKFGGKDTGFFPKIHDMLYLLVSLGKYLTLYHTMDILTLIVAVLLFTYTAWSKQRRKRPGRADERKHQTGKRYDFPQQEEGEVVIQPVEKLQGSGVKKKKKKKQKSQTQIEGGSCAVNRPAQDPVADHQTAAPGHGIAFRTPEDARRAFIYSEIFRRKYDD